jgi:hypothetical protein
MNTVPSAEQIFVLRFWQEAMGCDGAFRWRVQVCNVNTRQRKIADDVKAAFALVLAQLRDSTSGEEGFCKGDRRIRFR